MPVSFAQAAASVQHSPSVADPLPGPSGYRQPTRPSRSPVPLPDDEDDPPVRPQPETGKGKKRKQEPSPATSESLRNAKVVEEVRFFFSNLNFFCGLAFKNFHFCFSIHTKVSHAKNIQ